MDATSTTIQNSTGMHNLYTVSGKTARGYNTATYTREAKYEDAERKAADGSVVYTGSNIAFEQMTGKNRPISTRNDHDINNTGSISRGMTQVSDWPKEEFLDPVFITYNSGLTGYDTVEYFYDLSCEEDNPTLYMRAKSGTEENYYKLDINTINPSTATKAELLGYYSYQEYMGEPVDMYQLMADMDMAEHNGTVRKADNLIDAFLKYMNDWIKVLQNVHDTQKDSGDSKGAAATLELLHSIGA